MVASYPRPLFRLFMLGLAALLAVVCAAGAPWKDRRVLPPPRLVLSAAGVAALARPIPVYTYRIVHAYPHDPQAFTQGLLYVDGVLYEGTGLEGRSSLRQVELETGRVRQFHELPPQYFGEGLALYDDELIQLTWVSHLALVYDRDSFAPRREFHYPTEGWGLTYDGQQLIMSDGTSTLYFRDPQTFSETGRVQVYSERGPVSRLNELEYIQGKVLANVWQTELIAVIDPQTGRIVAWIDLQGLRPQGYKQPMDVLNGIAYDERNGRLFVTGKLWPLLFEIELVQR